ncbi:MAG: copper resistance protein B [Luteimonas sp.]
MITNPITIFCVGLLSAAVALAALPLRASAQEMDHSKMNMPAAKPAPAKKKSVVKKAATKPAAKPAPATKAAPAMDHSKMQMPATPSRKPVAKPLPKPAMKKTPAAKTPSAKPASKPSDQMDHSAMGHAMPTPARSGQAEPMDHSTMTDTAKPQPGADPAMQGMDHSAMGHDMPAPAKSGQAEPVDHSTMTDMAKPQSGADPSMQGMDHSAMGHDMSAMPGMSMAPTEPVTPIPVVTDTDRAAAVRPAKGHSVHDNSIQNYTLIDRLEVWDANPGTGLEWEAQTWIGTDLDRLWLRSEGERLDGRTESADLEVLYGRSVATWWDVVAGIRHDFKPGASQDFAAFGVIGLAPYKFEIEATAYIGQSGQTAARFEVEYETLLTNRLILQPLVEVNLHGKDDPRRGIGSGLSTVEAGLRLRYEFTRRFAPYIGIVRERAFSGTADFRRAEGEDIDDTRFVAGLRIWF